MKSASLVAWVLVLTGCGSSQQVKPAIPTVAQRVADQLTRRFVLEAVMAGRAFGPVRDEAEGWRLEEILGEALRGNYGNMATVDEMARLRVSDGTGTLASYGRSTPEKLREHLENVLSIASHDRAYRNEHNPNLDQEFQIKRNETVNEETAVEIIHLAAVCRGAFTPEFIEAVRKIKSGFEQAIGAHSDLLKPFAEAKSESEELKKSQSRVRQIMTQARAR
jgi:RPA family protein